MDLIDRSIDEYGKVYYTDDQIVNMKMCGININNFCITSEEDVIQNNNFKSKVDSDIEKLQSYKKSTIPIDEYFNDIKKNFIIPQSYLDIDLYNYLLSTCNDIVETKRIEYEYSIIVDREMVDFFKCIIYLVDFFRDNDILWGLGRGSSVSSFALYKIGIHKINSIKFNLDCHEFFK
ncbi:MAG: DNA polymerase III alpha subunit [Caudoviricetes sp.]|nr:MAG: DNA polymerase III alpha subunit [Caudoviricetes sp.]